MALSQELTESDLIGVIESFDTADFGLAIVDENGILQGVNNKLATMFSYGPDDLISQPAEIFWQGFRQQHQYHLFFMNLAERKSWQGELLCKNNQGTIFPVHLTWIFHPDHEGIAIGIFHDLTDRKRWESKILEARDSAERYLDISQAMIVALDNDGMITEINRRGCEILGYIDHEELIGKDWFEVAVPAHCRRQEKLLFEQMVKGEELPPNSLEGEVLTAQGENRYILWHHSVTHDEHNEITGSLSSGQDISLRKQAEQEIYRLAMTDHLTGLLNRRSFYERFQENLKFARRNNLPIACIAIDLDRFKPINDQYGHETGDKVLVQVAEKLTGNFRETDNISRMGGDEFAVVAVLSGDHQRLEKALQRLLSSLKEPMDIDGKTLSIGASVGVSYYPKDGEDMEELLRKADEALYRAKNAGRNRVESYS